MASNDTKKTNQNYLEIEGDDERQERIERLLASQPSSATAPPRPLISPLEERKTFAVPPPTALLARLEAFLPEMGRANEDLERRIAVSGQASVDIENLGDDAQSSDEDAEGEDEDMSGEDPAPRPKKPYIEMDLGLGVFEARPNCPTGSGSHEPHDTDSDSSDTSSTSSDDDETSHAKVSAPTRRL